MGELNMDEVNFIREELIKKYLEAFGWIYNGSHLTWGELAATRADFYPTGFVIAVSKKAVITCEGELVFKYKGEIYEDFDDLCKKLGRKAFDTLPDWEIEVEKEWTVRKNGEWKHSFSNFVELPLRKQLRC
tara:strand:+ start:7857 stop:8249 length:393 start_codon:yes stop_codon:yes gene_type:complete